MGQLSKGGWLFRDNLMAGRLDGIQLLVASGRTSAYRIGTALADVEKALETSAATRHLTTIDVCHSQVAVSIVGMFSLYESRLQSIYRWAKPFDEVQRLLESNGGTNQAEEFENFKLAVNVLKHGRGDSHSKLLSRSERLPFKVQSYFGEFHEEGDCCPPSDLILVSTELLELCCGAIESSWLVVQSCTPQTTA